MYNISQMVGMENIKDCDITSSGKPIGTYILQERRCENVVRFSEMKLNLHMVITKTLSITIKVADKPRLCSFDCPYFITTTGTLTPRCGLYNTPMSYTGMSAVCYRTDRCLIEFGSGSNDL